MSKYTTGEMAKLCNVSVRTVQFYDTKGILHPSDLTEGGRRIYNDDDLLKFRLICTLKAIGLSLDSIKGVLESKLSGKILTILLDEQAKLLTDEINEREKQLEMINVIRESIANKAIVPSNSILDVEHIMEKKNNSRNTRKLALVYTGVTIAATAGFLFMLWLIKSGYWWGLAAYLLMAVFGIAVSALTLRGTVFICPKCDSAISPQRKFFTTGTHKVRWMKCPNCGHKDWFVVQKQEQKKS